MSEQPISNTADEERSTLAAQTAASSNVSTERVRQHRRRKREGLRLAHLEVREREVAFLTGQGWLPGGQEDDAHALGHAVGRLLDLLMPELEARRIVIQRKQRVPSDSR